MPVNIHGKEYRTVAERIGLFYEEFGKREQKVHTEIRTEIVKDEDNIIQVKATIKVSNDAIQPDFSLVGTGFAEEDRSRGRINDTSALENCETSAIGRALASIGLGGEEYASADELANALTQQNHSGGGASTAVAGTIGFGKHKGKKWEEVPSTYIEWLLGREKTDDETRKYAQEEKDRRIELDTERHSEEEVKSESEQLTQTKEKSASASIGEVLGETNIKPTNGGGMSPLAQEKKKQKLAEELTGLSERMGVKKFIELKTKELGNKGFVDCSIEELQSLVSVAKDLAPKINPEQAKKNQELFETVVDKFDGEVIQ
tara:strand:- start:9380 stop:10330 length:951 start_codon:yes stop_codon:yes gene_type:complete